MNTSFALFALTAAAEPYALLAWWKPLVFMLPLLAWAWVVSKVLDKHAAKYFLNTKRWNALHMTIGLVALVAGLFVPIAGIGGLAVSVLIMTMLLAGDVVLYATLSARDERVPADGRLSFDFGKLGAALENRKAARQMGSVELVIKGPDKLAIAPPPKETPEHEVRVAAEAMLLAALEGRGSQAELIPTGKDNAYALSLLVDGVRQSVRTMPAAEAIKLVDFWVGAAKLDANDRRRKQTADIMVEKGMEKKKIRVTSIGGAGGQRLTLLVDPEGAVRRPLEQLGLLEPQIQDLRELTSQEKGVVLISGMPDGGMTTTLYSVIKLHDAYTKNVQTVELETQDALEGVKQNKFDPQAEGAELSTLVRSILRRDPDALALAEPPDQATAKEIAKADHNRTRIYVTLRAPDAMSGLQTWVRTVGEPGLASQGLMGLIAHRLVRKVCSNCRVAYQPAPDLLKKLGLPADKIKQLYRKGGQVMIKDKAVTCPACQGTGYWGQEGVFEIDPLTPADLELIKAGKLADLRLELRKRQKITLQQAALRKAIDGVTTIDEVMRLMGEPAAPKPPPGNPPAAGAPAPAPAPKPVAPVKS